MKKFSFTSAVLSLTLGLGLGLGLSAPATAAPVQWTIANGGNDNWYELVSPGQGKISASKAKRLAESSTYLGVSGYLATITSATEQAFLNGLNAAYTAAASNAHRRPYVRAWLGGTDAATEGTWEWPATGETFAYTNWANKANKKNADKKDYLAGWWRGDRWKDCRNKKRNCGVSSYLVEYESAAAAAAASAAISPVPVPASLPMIAAGLGLMAFVARRRKKA